MQLNRTIPPTAAPIYLNDLIHGLIGIFLGNRYIQRLEEELKAHFGVKHIFLVSSGKAALAIILLALKSQSSKKQVLIPAYTCFSVPSAIVKSGMNISLCDVNTQTFDFDYNLLEKAIDKDTLCVIPNHLFGIPADMDRINSLCKNKGVFVIEDAAQAMGGNYKGSKLGTIGDVGFFSLGRGKNITCGSGGIIITNSSQIADAIDKLYSNLKEPKIIESLKEFLQVLLMAIFIHPVLYRFPASLPFLKLGKTIFYKDFPIKKLSRMKAGLLHHWQERLEKTNKTRRENAEYFFTFIAFSSLVCDRAITYLRIPVLVNNKTTRENIFNLSQKNGLGVSSMYPYPINDIDEIRSHFNGIVFPAAKKISDELLTIPTHHLLSKKDKDNICKLFNM